MIGECEEDVEGGIRLQEMRFEQASSLSYEFKASHIGCDMFFVRLNNSQLEALLNQSEGLG